MTIARIYQPDKSAMQSGRASKSGWILEFVPEKPYFVDNLMGWVGMTDMPQEICLNFATQTDAIAYARKQGLEYKIYTKNQRRISPKVYADNFKFNRVIG